MTVTSKYPPIDFENPTTERDIFIVEHMKTCNAKPAKRYARKDGEGWVYYTERKTRLRCAKLFWEQKINGQRDKKSKERRLAKNG